MPPRAFHVAIVLLAACGCQKARAPASSPACLTGLYRSPSGEGIAVTQRAGKPGTLRVNDLQGHVAAMEPRPAQPDALVGTAKEGDPTTMSALLRAPRCDEDGITLRLGDQPEQRWARLPLRVTYTKFRSGDAELSGELIEPPNAAGPVPMFVMAHGSEATAAVDSSSLPFLMALQGVGAFVFDKRGTGGSGGTYTQNFQILAGDVAAAVETGRQLAGARASRWGVAGFSQGGWVAPLAATKTPVDFVVAAYGVVGTAQEQDAWQVDYQLRAAGFAEADVEKARAITALAGRVAESDFQSGMPELAAAVKAQGAEPWMAKIDGQFSGLLVRGEVERARKESPGVLWRFDTREVLAKLTVPQLWLFAEGDSVAPYAPSMARMTELQRAGKPITIKVLPGADHGMHPFTPRPDGSHAAQAGYIAGYLPLLAGWMRGQKEF